MTTTNKKRVGPLAPTDVAPLIQDFIDKTEDDDLNWKWQSDPYNANPRKIFKASFGDTRYTQHEVRIFLRPDGVLYLNIHPSEYNQNSRKYLESSRDIDSIEEDEELQELLQSLFTAILDNLRRSKMEVITAFRMELNPLSTTS